VLTAGRDRWAPADFEGITLMRRAVVSVPAQLPVNSKRG
jgi:hypothetical protein